MYAKMSTFGIDFDTKMMEEALAQARKAFQKGEVPIGAVVVNSTGEIIGKGYNQTETAHTQSAHAEVKALAQAGKKNGDWRLTGCWIYVTLEPCLMCMSLIKLSRLAGVVYGPRSKLFGFHKIIDKEMSLPVYKDDTLQIVEGVQTSQSLSLLKNFFQPKRMKGSSVSTKKKSGKLSSSGRNKKAAQRTKV